MRIRWRPVPEKSLDRMIEVRQSGTPTVDIAITIHNHMRGVTHFGSNNGVEAFARRHTNKYILVVGKSYATMPLNSTDQEIINALSRRLAYLISTDNWGVKMQVIKVDVPDLWEQE